MALEFINIEPKTGERLESVPHRVAEHTYLEHRLAQAQAAGDLPQYLGLYVASIYEGVSVADLEYLKQTQGLHCIGSNRRSAYLVDDPAVAKWIQQQIFTNQSDPVAYFSVVMSDAESSTVLPQARVLVMDDGVGVDASPSQKWGRRKLKNREGNPIDPMLLAQAHRLLGDGYCLIAPELHRQVSRESAIEAAHQKADEGSLAIAQCYRLSETALGETEWQPDQIRDLLIDRLEEAIGRAIPEGRTESTNLNISRLKLETDSIRGQVATARWSYSDLATQEVYAGRVLLQQAGAEPPELFLVGGASHQQITVCRMFEAVVNADLTPFQLRGGVSEWKGAFKGTARSASLCQQMGVDAILPRSAIKADGKTVPLGISEVKDLFWARKSNARANTQRLGTQVLVNLPQGTRSDVLPKLGQRQAELAQAMSDPRRLADLYCEAYERRQQMLDAESEADLKLAQTKNARADWLYTLLKADSRPRTAVVMFDSARWLQNQRPDLDLEQRQLRTRQLRAVEAQIATAWPTPEALSELVADALGLDLAQIGSVDDLMACCETTQVGGYAQILEMPKVVERLYEFVQTEWINTMSGGVLVPSATAQPHPLLRPGEVCFPQMPHGARVSVFRSPVANVGQMKVMTNNLKAIAEGDREAYIQQGVVYLNSDDAKAMVVDFDIDAVALIPDETFVRARPVAAPALRPGQCCVPTLEPGERVSLYDGGEPVSLINTAIEADETAGRNMIYLSEAQYESLPRNGRLFYGHYDGLHGFKTLNDEVDYLTQPERRPAPVQKRTKIPRDANHPDIAKLSHQEQEIARSFTTLEQAIIHATDNPTGTVANIGMRLQSLKQHLDACDTQGQIQQVKAASREFRKLLEEQEQEFAWKQTFRVPPDLANGYSFRLAMQDIAQVVPPISKCALLVAQLQQGDDSTLLTVLKKMQSQYRRCLSGDLPRPQFLPSNKPKEYSFEQEVQWLSDSHRYLMASSQTEQAEQARRVVVPRLVYLLEQLDQLPNGHHQNLRVPLTNYQKWSDVEQYGDRLGDDALALRRVLDLKRLLEVVQHQLIDPELQTAVETDKSARPVNSDVLEFARCITQYQSVDWIKDKKREDLYLPQVNPKTGALEGNSLAVEDVQDPIGQIVAQTNRYFRSAQGYQAQNPLVYRGLVPLPDHNRLELHQSAQSIVRHYSQRLAEAEALKRSTRDNPGPQLIIQTPDLNLPLRVTNLTRFDPQGVSPLWEALRQGQPFEVEIRVNSAEELQGVLPKACKAYLTRDSHSYQVVGRFGEWDDDPRLYSLGTLAEGSAELLKQNLQLKGLDLEEILAQPLQVEQVKLTPNRDWEHVEGMITEAEENLAQWVESVSFSPTEQEAAFRALYHAGRLLGHELTDSDRPGTAGGMALALRLFPQQVIPYLEQYSLTETRVTGMNHHALRWREAVGAAADWQGQVMPVRVGVLDEPGNVAHGRLVWQVGYDAPHPDGGYQRQWQTVGTAHQNNLEPDKLLHEADYRLPIGVEALARITPISPRYQITHANGLKFNFAACDQQQRLNALAQQQQSVRLGVERKPGTGNWNVVLYPASTELPVVVGRLSRDSAQMLKLSPGKPGKTSLPPQDYQISALPLQAARLEILPESVQRPHQWIAPTIEAWRTFMAQEQQHPTRLEQPQYRLEPVLDQTSAVQQSESTVGGRVPGQAEAKAEVKVAVNSIANQEVSTETKPSVKPGKAHYQTHYQAQLQRIGLYLKDAEVKCGALPPGLEDVVIAIQMLRDRLQQHPGMDVRRDPVNVEIIRTLSASPEAQSRLKAGGRQAMCDYINAQMQVAQKRVDVGCKEQMQGSGIRDR